MMIRMIDQVGVDDGEDSNGDVLAELQLAVYVLPQDGGLAFLGFYGKFAVSSHIAVQSNHHSCLDLEDAGKRTVVKAATED